MSPSKANKAMNIDQVELFQFLNDVACAPEMAKTPGSTCVDYDGMPFTETSLDIVKHYNAAPSQMKSFEVTGYFVYKNVRVYEKGTREKILAKIEEQEELKRKRG